MIPKRKAWLLGALVVVTALSVLYSLYGPSNPTQHVSNWPSGPFATEVVS